MLNQCMWCVWSTCKIQQKTRNHIEPLAKLIFSVCFFVLSSICEAGKPSASNIQKAFSNISPRFSLFLVRSFNLPRVAQQLERLMGSRWEFYRISLLRVVDLIGYRLFSAFSVVRLTDRKYMLDLQKRIHEDYHDTLMKRISQRQVRAVKCLMTSLLRQFIDHLDLAMDRKLTFDCLHVPDPFSSNQHHKSAIWSPSFLCLSP